ncbi:MAG: TadE/TadG family type IV pilus assembly protein [Actinomycetota bacterium]
MSPRDRPPTGDRPVGRAAAYQSRSGTAGQSTVELALVLPVLAIAALAVVQVARVAADRVAIEHAAGAAARQAAVTPDPSAVVAHTARAAPDLDPARLVVELGPERVRGSLVEVRVRYRSPTDVPLVGRLVGDVELVTTAVVRIE